MVNDVIHLFFPRLCAGCHSALRGSENIICLSCTFQLPKTHFHKNGQNNPLSSIFWGRAPVSFAAAYLNFRKQSMVQNLLHELKYGAHPELGIFLGTAYGMDLKDEPGFADNDLIIPVPLHPKRLKERGYNQSEEFAKGLSQVLSIPIEANTLIRRAYQGSQTNLNRYQRWENVEHVFSITNESCISQKSILLVDDVLTTGATLEACIHPLIQSGAKRISVACIAAPVY
ncbi:MAG: ComF family protein [Bacteroidia bacterium]|jgi:ComF family protein